MGQYVPVPATGAVSAGMGTVWENHSRGIPVRNPKCLGKCVGNHVVGRAINKVNCPIIYNESNKMIPYIDMLGTSVIRPVMGECDSGL